MSKPSVSLRYASARSALADVNPAIVTELRRGEGVGSNAALPVENFIMRHGGSRPGLDHFCKRVADSKLAARPIVPPAAVPATTAWFVGLGPGRELCPRDRAGFENLVLQIEDRLQQLLWSRRAAWNIDIHGNEAINPLAQRRRYRDAAAGGTDRRSICTISASALQPDALQNRSIFMATRPATIIRSHCRGEKLHGLGTEAGNVVPGGAGGH